jgi:hypothetical protein
LKAKKFKQDYVDELIICDKVSEKEDESIGHGSKQIFGNQINYSDHEYGTFEYLI